MRNEEKYKTAEERGEAFELFCDSMHKKHISGPCPSCPAFGGPCAFNWLALECEDEKPLPCPFCGGNASVIEVMNYTAVAVRCDSCHATSGNYDTKAEAIAAWNRRVK